MTDKKSTFGHRILTGIGIVLCVILIPMLIINCTLLIKGCINKDKVPTIFGYAPMIVLTDSMASGNDDSFNGGDLIFIKAVKTEDLKAGDIISFFNPLGNGSTITSHRIIGIVNDENGKILFKTHGDNNSSEDKAPVPAENLVGKYTGFRIAGAGHSAMFMQTTWGMVICAVLPIILLIGWDTVCRARYNKKRKGDEAALLAELEQLRAEKTIKENAEVDSNRETVDN